MHITQWGEYGIHCSVAIARKEAQSGQAVSAAEIAEVQHIPLQYTQQILQRLRRKSVIKSVRGPQGGYRLARSPKEITLYDILLACEGESFAVICEAKPLNPQRCSPTTQCNLRPVWYKLREHVNSFLGDYTLDAILIESAGMERPVKIGERRGKK